jgi:hypothetical protein
MDDRYGRNLYYYHALDARWSLRRDTAPWSLEKNFA